MMVSKAPWLALLAAVALGCASRTVPAHFSQASAASPDSPAAAPARVTRALADLPLPGEPGAELLEPAGSAAPAAAGQHTGHHAGHDHGH